MTNFYKMKTERLHLLFNLYLDEKCTRSEEAELMNLLADPANDNVRKDLVEKYYDELPEKHLINKADADRIFRQIVGKQESRKLYPFMRHNKVLRWVSLAAAVSIILISISVVLFRNNKPINEINQVVEIVKPIDKPLYKNDVKPGGNKAVLTLADGSKIILDDATEGALTRQGNTTIIKLDSGRLAYNVQSVSKIQSKAILYNTLSTPRGGQYSVTLPDGTKVWLNSSTSLRFPIAFAGDVRRVEVKGEAYFEVAKNAAMPFIVKAGNEEIKVLGTHFNVMAYADDKVIKTTLLEGSVEVSLTNSSKSESTDNIVTLQPGQQSQLNMNNGLTVVSADIEEAIGWKNGFFIFNSEDIESIMLKISRWYDVKVEYQVNPTERVFTGNISRSQNVSEVLKMLELTEAIHFKIEGKSITVLP
jgi:ferric-dicitrate binding protein FerR (iron transport regulator)